MIEINIQNKKILVPAAENRNLALGDHNSKTFHFCIKNLIEDWNISKSTCTVHWHNEYGDKGEEILTLTPDTEYSYFSWTIKTPLTKKASRFMFWITFQEIDLNKGETTKQWSTLPCDEFKILPRIKKYYHNQTQEADDILYKGEVIITRHEN